MSGYMIRDAVTDALLEIPYGAKFTTHEFYGRVMHNLRLNGSDAVPMEESVSRVFRKYKKDFNVQLVKHGQATWVKRRDS